jgi:membrane-bound lytic murein transglycosylase D
MKSTSSETLILIRPSRTPRVLASSLIAVIIFLDLAGNASSLGATVNNKNFPTYPAIQDNVTFWEKIYTKYSTSEAVIHDRNNVTKIYEVIPIVDYLRPGAGQINKPLLDTAKQKYIAILSRLAMGNPPITKEEHRIAAMYKGACKSQLQKASESIRVQIGQKERFREGVVRSCAYLPEIKRIFRSYNLPEELAYLPHVESSFNPDAYSKVGACGLWQFTRTTGKQYLRIDDTIDERQDPYRASHAAAKFLKRNHSILGSWPLALTAYNYGTSGMARAKKDKGSYEKIFLEYEEGYFKFASRNFYPEFLAAIRAAQKLEKNPSLHRHRHASTTTVRIEKRTSTDADKPSLLQGKKHLPKGEQLTLQPRHRVIKNERL